MAGRLRRLSSASRLGVRGPSRSRMSITRVSVRLTPSRRDAASSNRSFASPMSRAPRVTSRINSAGGPGHRTRRALPGGGRPPGDRPSRAVALTARQEETLIGVVQFIALPLTFLSAAFMQLSLAPGWIQDVARFNPVNWAVEAGREAVSKGPDWGFVLGRLGLLAAVTALFIWIATRAFRAYQRSA